MIPLILPTCLRVSTPTTASASAGPDTYPLVSTVNIPYLHASHSLPTPPPPPPPFLALVIILCFIRGNLRCQLSVLLDVRCLRDSSVFNYGSQMVSNAIVATVSTEQMGR